MPNQQKIPECSGPDLQARLGAAIKAQRQRLGVTQEELAWRAERHRTYIADLERGRRNVTLRSIANLARALQVTVESLLSPSPEPAKAGRLHRAASNHIGEVLLVEDSPADVELTLLAFKLAKFANPVKVVGDGEEALDYLFCTGQYAGRRARQPQLVLLDLNLPKISGLEVLRKIKADRQTRDIPVVILTGSRYDRNIMECSRLGLENYIVKPVGFESLSKVTPKLNLHWALVKPRVTFKGNSE